MSSKMVREEIVFVIRPQYKRTEIAFEEMSRWQVAMNRVFYHELDAIKVVSTAVLIWRAVTIQTSSFSTRIKHNNKSFLRNYLVKKCDIKNSPTLHSSASEMLPNELSFIDLLNKLADRALF